MANFKEAIARGFGKGELPAALNYNRYDKFGGQKIGGLYMDGVLKDGGIVQKTHEASSTQNYLFGATRRTIDGRVYKYAKASNIVSVRHFGLKFWGQIGDGAAAVTPAAAVVGSSFVTITKSGIAADEFVGGYFMSHGTPTQFRGIIGNTATSGTTIIIELDEPLTTALVATTTYCEILHSPYANVRLTAGPSGGDSGNDYSSVAGMPAITTDTANYYLWIQTWGPIWINPHGSSLQDAGITGGERKVVFDVEGSICIEDDVAHGPGADGDEHQLAGFIIDRSAASTSGPPLVMLQITPW